MAVDSNAAPHNPLLPHLALLAVQILFGTWPIVGKIVLRTISSSQLVVYRLLGAALVFVLIQRNLKPLLRMRRKDFAWLTLCSLMGIIGNQLLYIKGLSLTTVINTTLLNTTMPAFTLFVSILFGYDRLSGRRVLGILLAAIGVIYLVNPLRADLSHQTTVGNLLIVCNSLLYSAYIVLSKDLFERYGALNVITWLFLLSAIFAIPIGIYSISYAQLLSVSPTVWLLIAFIVLLPTVGAYYLNSWALVKVSPSTVAVYIYLQPLIAFGVTPLILGETWSWRTVVAAVLIFAGVAVVIKRGRSQAVREISEHPDALAH